MSQARVLEILQRHPDGLNRNQIRKIYGSETINIGGDLRRLKKHKLVMNVPNTSPQIYRVIVGSEFISIVPKQFSIPISYGKRPRVIKEMIK